MTITVRVAAERDFEAWEALWRGYVAFYQAEVADEVTRATWTRCLSEAWPMDCLLALRGDQVVGFAIVVVHLGTWSRRSVGYLEDLFVAPQARRGGVGRALIAALEVRGRQYGWHRLYWQTHKDNQAAQALYDQMAERTDWVRYDLDIR
jgi:GNAT superfamily N-acetyltransferase